MEQITFEKVDSLVAKQKSVTLPRTASASPKSLKVNTDKLKALWPTVKAILQFAKPILPKKWKGIIDSFIAVVDVVVGGGLEGE